MTPPQITISSSGGNFLTKALARVTSSLTTMRHAAQSLFLGNLLKRTRFDYAREVGDMLDSSVVMAPVMWLQRALPEATLAMRERMAGGVVEDLEEHEMLELIRNPNPFYGDIALWNGTVADYTMFGNAYWLKVRDTSGRVRELWYVPQFMMEPKAGYDGSEFLSHYEYNSGFGRIPIAPEDVVHFRNGMNPRDLRRGYAPMQGVIREIFADMESSNFVASLLRNMGVPGVVISPKNGAMPTADDVQATKTWFAEAFGGDNRGGTLVMGAPTDVQPYGFNPQQMNLSEARDVAEERVCAALGIPAAVVGFGAGLQATKVGATMEEMRKLAWHNGVLPLGRALADELQRSLLPDFERPGRGTRRRRIELYWNVDDVLALSEDEDKQIARKLKEFEAGAITLYDYLSETGREADESHRYYLRPIAKLEVPLAMAGKGREADQLSDAGNMVDPALPAPDPTKALPAPAAKMANPLEDYLPAGARDASPDAIERGERFALMLRIEERAHREAFSAALLPLFEGWGDAAGRVAGDVLRNRAEKALETKESELVQQIIDLLNLEAWEQGLSSRYQAQYLAIARKTAAALEQSGFGTDLPDPVARQILAAGGTRAGLIDIDAQTRQAIFDALAEGRAQGEGVQALANRIANQVEGGHWDSAETRARVIARTETKHAQNISTLEAGAAAGVREYVIFDGRFGEPRSELSHIARDGKIVSAADARIMADNMRPNCTLSFAPHFSF